MLFLGCCLLLICPTRVQCQSFEWDASSDLVSADFGHATLGQALESIAEALLDQVIAAQAKGWSPEILLREAIRRREQTWRAVEANHS